MDTRLRLLNIFFFDIKILNILLDIKFCNGLFYIQEEILRPRCQNQIPSRATSGDPSNPELVWLRKLWEHTHVVAPV